MDGEKDISKIHYVIQIQHRRGYSYWIGDLSGNKNGFGSLYKAHKYRTRESAERELPDITISYESVYYLGYLTESLEVKELSNEGKIIEPNTTSRRYKR